MRILHLLVCLLGFLACHSASRQEVMSLPETVSESHLPIEEEEKRALGEDQQQALGELEQRLIDAGLVNVVDVIPEAIVDLKYSSTDNFFGTICKSQIASSLYMWRIHAGGVYTIMAWP